MSPFKRRQAEAVERDLTAFRNRVRLPEPDCSSPPVAPPVAFVNPAVLATAAGLVGTPRGGGGGGGGRGVGSFVSTDLQSAGDRLVDTALAGVFGGGGLVAPQPPAREHPAGGLYSPRTGARLPADIAAQVVSTSRQLESVMTTP